MNTTRPLAGSRRASRDAGPARRVSRRLAAGALIVTAAGMAGAAPAAVASTSAAASPASQAASAPAGDISWSVSPASAKAPDFRTKYSYINVKPGATITDHLAVLNHGAQAVSFELYGTDATGTTPSNVLELLPATGKPADIGTWVAFGKHVAKLSVVVPPGKGVLEPFTIAVPRSATPGDHVGGVVGQVSFQRSNSAGQVVTENQRIAVPLYLRVAGPLHSALAVESVSAGLSTPLSPWGKGTGTVSFTVHNTGNIILAGSQQVTISSPLGSVKARLTSLPSVLPGKSVRLTVKPGGLFPAGPMTAHVKLGPAAPPGETKLAVPLAYVTRSAPLFAAPWATIALILLIIAVILGAWQFRRLRQSRLQDAISAVADHVRKETEKRLLGKAAEPQGKA